MAFIPNENYNGLTKLKEFWPIVKENFQKVKDEFAENSFTEEYRSKLSGIADGATKVEASSTNGNIKINGTETQVYVHPTNAGNKHIPAGGSGGQYLKYSGQSGTAQWAKISADDITPSSDKMFISQEEKEKLANIAVGATKTEGSEFNGYIRINNNAVRVYTHPTGEGNKHVPSGGSDGQYLKFSEAGTAQWATISADDIETTTDKQFVSSSEKSQWNDKQDALGYTPENIANKGEAGGYAPLDNNKLIPAQYIPQNALFQSYANTFVGDAEGSTIAVTDVQDYTNARGLTIEGKVVEKPINNLIPESGLKFEKGGTEYYSWRTFFNANVTITQNQEVPEWESTTATRIQISDGTNKKKYFMAFPQYYSVDTKFWIKIKIKNVGTAPLIISDLNDNIIDQISPNEVKFVDTIYTGTDFTLVFASQNISDNLDFYAEDPFVAVFYKYADNPHQILGVGESGNITTIVNGETVYETTLPAPLYALSDSKKDYVDITEGKIYKITNKIVCDGSENWGLTLSQPSDNSLARFGLTISNFALDALGIYSHGDWFGGNMFISRPEGAGVTSSQITVHIAKSRISGWDDSLTSTQKVSLFKNWLSAQALIGQPVTFVYEIATPTVTDITPQTVPLYAPTTNITTNDELQPTIRLTYNRDSNKVISDLQNQINQLKTALALLS